jgi:protoporphyrinogen oxidase
MIPGMNKNIAVIGSGLPGMMIALHLAKAGENVTMFESSNEIGGPVSSWEMDDVSWDKYHRSNPGSEPDTIKLIDELGLGEDYISHGAATGIYTQCGIRPIAEMMDILKLPHLDLFRKVRLCLAIRRMMRIDDPAEFERITAEDWLVKLSGRKVFDQFWRPLLKASMGDSLNETSAAFALSEIRRTFSAAKTLINDEFGYLRGGYSRLLERLGEALIDNGVEIRLNSRVETVEKLDTEKLEVRVAARRRHKDVKPRVMAPKTKYASFRAAAVVTPGFSGGFLSVPDFDPENVIPFPRTRLSDTFDRVIMTCPPETAANIAPQLSKHERFDLRHIRYRGMICASVLLKYSPSPFYITKICGDAPFDSVIELTALVGKKEFGGKALIYLPKYVSPDSALFDEPDEKIKESFLDGLARIHTKLKREDVAAFKVFRVKKMLPVPVPDHFPNMPKQKTSVAGLYILNLSQIPGIARVTDSICLVESFYRDHFSAR